MNHNDTNYLSFLNDQRNLVLQEIYDCQHKEAALNDQMQMLNETKNYAISERIRLEKEIAAMKELDNPLQVK